MAAMTRAFLLATLSVAMPAPAFADGPIPVTTDTAEYCIELADRLAEQPDMPPHAQLLWQSGRNMCEHGHVRGGLARLRRAMLMVRGVAE